MMKILLLHPDDAPDLGPWAVHAWDLIVDLGFASPRRYSEWSRRSGARVISIREFAAESYRRVGDMIAQGRGRLLDGLGLDWWEIAAVWAYQDLESLYLAYQLADQLPRRSVLFTTRPHKSADLLSRALASRLHSFRNRDNVLLRTYAKQKALRQFSAGKLLEIAADKWDSTYRLRRHFEKRLTRSDGPVTVLPSAYSNVTRTLLSYAASLPDRLFLLVTTRASAKSRVLPDNVRAVSLAPYAVSSQVTNAEIEELTAAWKTFTDSCRDHDLLSKAVEFGIFDYFPRQLRNGLLVRDAWRNLMREQPVAAVLVADDLNYFTRLPLILAGQMGLSSAYCSHGALDGSLLFKRAYASVHLVKGEMERDYMARSGSVAPENIIVAAPAPVFGGAASARPRNLVFFSQPYELDGGRTCEIYREIIPRLCSVAHETCRQVLIKLHPFELLENRRRILKTVLSRADFEGVRLVANVAAQAVIDEAWCGVGLDSSVAVECALKGIPFFLCEWLDFGGAGYLKQFARFGAGLKMHSPDELDKIPEMVASYRPDPGTIKQLWSPANPDLLDRILFGKPSELSANGASAAD
jgi:hypothetical protein